MLRKAGPAIALYRLERAHAARIAETLLGELEQQLGRDAKVMSSRKRRQQHISLSIALHDTLSVDRRLARATAQATL